MPSLFDIVFQSGSFLRMYRNLCQEKNFQSLHQKIVDDGFEKIMRTIVKGYLLSNVDPKVKSYVESPKNNNIFKNKNGDFLKRAKAYLAGLLYEYNKKIAEEEYGQDISLLDPMFPTKIGMIVESLSENLSSMFTEEEQKNLTSGYDFYYKLLDYTTDSIVSQLNGYYQMIDQEVDWSSAIYPLLSMQFKELNDWHSTKPSLTRPAKRPRDDDDDNDDNRNNKHRRDR